MLIKWFTSFYWVLSIIYGFYTFKTFCCPFKESVTYLFRVINYCDYKLKIIIYVYITNKIIVETWGPAHNSFFFTIDKIFVAIPYKQF